MIIDKIDSLSAVLDSTSIVLPRSQRHNVNKHKFGHSAVLFRPLH